MLPLCGRAGGGVTRNTGTALAPVQCVTILRTFALALALVAGACASLPHAEAKVLASDPAPDAGFIEQPEDLEPLPDGAPFSRMWVSPDRDWAHYPKIYVAVVDVSHVLEMSWWDKLNIRKSKIEYDLVVVADEL